ncbi:YkgJ family cysteine cluster protein [Thiobacillus denitrificans]|uniref:YkgJ family cysteine cluster protein n=1 Tax=Thiobacillus denitrificans TaxID=36861 RepID=UPI0003742B8A|nr:YkgJ family cysteine cluster protein [Thiobacillus denitrificans]
MTFASIKELRRFVTPCATAAQADLDARMATVPSVCSAGCDACCYQMVSVHTWEEELIGSYIEGTMHAATRAKVRRQLVEWWKHLKSILRPVSRANPLALGDVQALAQYMIDNRVMCPFLVDHRCSIYPVRPAMCRAHVVAANPGLCATMPGRVGETIGVHHMLATFGPGSPHLPFDKYVHAMKPLAFAMTGALKVPASSTPLTVVTLGELMPTRL